MDIGMLFKFKDDLFVIKHITESTGVLLPNIKIRLIAYDESEKPFSMVAAKENKDIFLIIGFKLFNGIKIKEPHYKCLHNGRTKYILTSYLEKL